MAAAIILSLAILTVQAGAIVAQIRCNTKPVACCCTPRGTGSPPCPMVKQAPSSPEMILPTKASLSSPDFVVTILMVSHDHPAFTSVSIRSAFVRAPPGGPSHRRPSLRAPPALA